MKKLAVLAMAGLMSVTASAANWVLINKNPIAAVYVDTASITGSSNFKKAFTRLELTNAELLEFDTMTSLIEFDCRPPAKNRTLSITTRKNRIVVDKVAQFTNSPWGYVEPDTIGGMEANFVCSYQK